jgi:uncharacterized membrane-anchored protein
MSTRSTVARRLLRVPEITLYFWIIKGLSTALGEATSDYLVHVLHPVPAVLLGFVCFLFALGLQFSRRRYLAWAYWLAVCMVGVFGTMAADVLHVGFGVPYYASSALYGVALAAVFVTWQKSEKTLSIHSIDRFSRVGDLTAVTFHLGYLLSGLLFAAVIAIPALGYWRFHWNAIFAFWFAYVITRPLGASFADWMGKPTSARGLGWGEGPVSLGFAVIIAVLVAYLSVTHKDVQGERHRERPASSPPASNRVVHQPRGLLVRILVWLALLMVAAVVAFIVGYLIGPHFVARVL